MSVSEKIIIDVGSIGWGVQSTWLLFAAAYGEMPRCDAYIFSDLLRESREVYEYREYAIPILRSFGIEVNTIYPGDIYKEILSWPVADRVSMIPVWFYNPKRNEASCLNRQCTGDYKINAIAGEIRRITGRSRLSRHSVRIWQGISYDEKSRVLNAGLMPTGRNSFRVNHFPYIPQYANLTYPEFNWRLKSREDIINDFKRKGLKIPPKSSCFFCPFHTIEYWYHIYINYPEEWELACILDDSIRSYNSKNETLENGPFFLYQGLIPLREIDFEKELAKAKSKLNGGGCQTGFCFV